MATIGTVTVRMKVDTTALRIMRDYHESCITKIDEAIARFKKADEEASKDGDDTKVNL